MRKRAEMAGIGADHARGAWLWCLSGIDL